MLDACMNNSLKLNAQKSLRSGICRYLVSRMHENFA